MKLEFRIPLKTVGGLNARLHHFARAAKAKRERRLTRDAWAEAGQERIIRAPGNAYRVLVKLERVGPNETDDDNLPGLLKAVRDEMTELLGFKSDRDPLLRFVYAQRSEGHVTGKNPKTGKRVKRGIYAVEVGVQRQTCADCFVEHCECIHLKDLCADCAQWVPEKAYEGQS